MGQIIFVGGRRGGTGKSTTSNALVYLYDLYKVAYKLVDADTNNPDVAELNGFGIKDIEFSIEDDESALMSKRMENTDRIFELATANIDSDLIVNLPADVENKIIYWFEDNELLHRDSEQTKVRFSYWFLSNGSYNSVSLFLKLLKKLSGPNLDWVFVRNCGLCTDWSGVDKRAEFIKAKEDYQVIDIKLPGIPALERDFLEKHQITFKASLTDTRIPLISRQRLTKILKKLGNNFIDSGALPKLKAQLDSQNKSDDNEQKNEVDNNKKSDGSTENGSGLNGNELVIVNTPTQQLTEVNYSGSETSSTENQKFVVETQEKEQSIEESKSTDDSTKETSSTEIQDNFAPQF